ncbi:hypothetical protein MKX03_021534, partial [Papaver bracteatum]
PLCFSNNSWEQVWGFECGAFGNNDESTLKRQTSFPRSTRELRMPCQLSFEKKTHKVYTNDSFIL